MYLTSLDNREHQISAGTVSEVGLAMAARHLCERTHEIATAEEIAAYQARCNETRQQIDASGKRHINQELRISMNK